MTAFTDRFEAALTAYNAAIAKVLDATVALNHITGADARAAAMDELDRLVAYADSIEPAVAADGSPILPTAEDVAEYDEENFEAYLAGLDEPDYGDLEGDRLEADLLSAAEMTDAIAKSISPAAWRAEQIANYEAATMESERAAERAAEAALEERNWSGYGPGEEEADRAFEDQLARTRASRTAPVASPAVTGGVGNYVCPF